MDLTKVLRTKSDCGIPFIKLVTTSECKDSISDSYYGSGKVVGGSSGLTTKAFPYQKITNLKGFVSRSPREIIRQVSLNCRAQKASSVKPFIIQGADKYPVWKMEEIEDQFHAKHIFVDGYEVVFRGGTIFREYRNKSTGQFILEAKVEECTRSQIYGCGTCTDTSTVVRIPEIAVTESFFNESGIKIASSIVMLTEWFRNQEGVTEVTDITNEVEIKCESRAIVSLKGTGAIPNMIYFDSPSPENKIYAHKVNDENPDYSVLCGGIDNTACAQVYINDPEVYEMTCEPLVLGIPEVYIVGAACNIYAFPNWQDLGLTSLTTNDPQRTLNLSLFNPDYVLPSNPEGAMYSHTFADEDTCNHTTTIPASATVTEVQINEIPLDSIRWSFDNGVLSFNPCLEPGNVLTAKFGSIAPPILSGQIIAQINGQGCAPSTLRSFSHYDHPSIPLGSTLVIEPSGNIKWIGKMTNSNSEGSVIELQNIVYNI